MSTKRVSMFKSRKKYICKTNELESLHTLKDQALDLPSSFPSWAILAEFELLNMFRRWYTAALTPDTGVEVDAYRPKFSISVALSTSVTFYAKTLNNAYRNV